MSSDPITYGDLVRELHRLQNKWMIGRDWYEEGIKYDDFCTGYDEGQQQCSIILGRLIEKTGIPQDD